MTNETELAEWFLHSVILFGANDISVDLDNKRVLGIRFRFPGGREARLQYNVDRHPPCALEVRRGGGR